MCIVAVVGSGTRLGSGLESSLGRTADVESDVLRGDGGGDSSGWFAIRRPPNAWDKLRSPSITTHAVPHKDQSRDSSCKATRGSAAD